MPVGYEFGGPFLGQGQVGTGYGMMTADPREEARFKLENIGAIVGLNTPIFRKNVRELADICQAEFAENPQRNAPEVREGLIDRCTDHFDQIVRAHLTADMAWQHEPPWWEIRMPTPELTSLYFQIIGLSYQYIMDDEDLRNHLRQNLKSWFWDVMGEVDWRVLIMSLNTGGLGARPVIKNVDQLRFALAFRQWLDGVHFNSNKLWNDLLQDPREVEKIERKAPELLAPAISDEELYEKFPGKLKVPSYSGWYPGIRKKKYAV